MTTDVEQLSGEEEGPAKVAVLSCLVQRMGGYISWSFIPPPVRKV